jgi:hypothetical protein
MMLTLRGRHLRTGPRRSTLRRRVVDTRTACRLDGVTAVRGCIVGFLAHRRHYHPPLPREGTRCWFGDQFPLIAPEFAPYGVDLWVPELGGKPAQGGRGPSPPHARDRRAGRRCRAADLRRVPVWARRPSHRERAQQGRPSGARPRGGRNRTHTGRPMGGGSGTRATTGLRAGGPRPRTWCGFRRSTPDRTVRSRRPVHPEIILVEDFTGTVAAAIEGFGGTTVGEKERASPAAAEAAVPIRGRIRCSVCMPKSEAVRARTPCATDARRGRSHPNRRYWPLTRLPCAWEKARSGTGEYLPLRSVPLWERRRGSDLPMPKHGCGVPSRDLRSRASGCACRGGPRGAGRASSGTSADRLLTHARADGRCRGAHADRHARRCARETQRRLTGRARRRLHRDRPAILSEPETSIAEVSMRGRIVCVSEALPGCDRVLEVGLDSPKDDGGAGCVGGAQGCSTVSRRAISVNAASR